LVAALQQSHPHPEEHAGFARVRLEGWPHNVIYGDNVIYARKVIYGAPRLPFRGTACAPTSTQATVIYVIYAGDVIYAAGGHQWRTSSKRSTAMAAARHCRQAGRMR
jgi:hypothetical protein